MELQPLTNALERCLPADRNSSKDIQNLKVKKQCKEFESFLYNSMLKSMRATVPDDGLFSGGNAENIYTSMLDMEYSKMMSEKMDSGLADTLYRQLMQKQHNTEPFMP